MTDDFTKTLRAVVERLDALGISYMLVGSIAALAHGRSRTTHDLDLVVEATLEQLEQLVASLPADRFYASREAALQALREQTMFNVIDVETGWKVDLVPKKRRPFSASEFARRRRLDVLGLGVFVASIEDTIISKLEWAKLAGGSARQLEDAAELIASHEAMDFEYIERWVTELALEREWQAARAQAAPP